MFYAYNWMMDTPTLHPSPKMREGLRRRETLFLLRGQGPVGLLVFIVFALTACGASDVQLTVKAEHDLAGAQIVSRRSTATVVRARMQTTQDFAVTRVGEVMQAERYLYSTLGALGTEEGFIQDSLTLAHGTAALTPPPDSPVAVGRAAAPPARFTDSPAAVRIPTDSISFGNQPRLENIVLASGKDRDGCAVDSNPRFTPTSTEIYVIARAYHIPAGAIVASSWRRMGTEAAAISFQTEGRIHDRCIWLFIDQSDAAFSVGRWSVELRLDGQSLALVPFRIFED